MRDLSRSEERPVEEVEARRLRKAKFERVRSVSKCKKPELPLATVGTTEEKARRETGIDILGEVRWGTHFCVFYQSKQDLIDILVPYFKEGLENNEFCMWITSEPLSAEDAKKSLSQAVTNLDDYIKKGQIEILDYSDWYTKSGVFEADRVLQGWVQKHDQAIRNGFDGLRLTGNTLWLEKKDWIKFTEYEAVVNSVIGKYRMLAICTYSLDKCGASEILDVEHNHQFALIKWRGDWKILESSSKNQLEARLAEQTAIAKVLERSKKDWVKTFNAMSDWVALIDLKGRILHTNRAGENFTGKTLDEIIGQSCCKLVHGQDKHIPNCPLRTMLHSRQRATAELNVPNTDRWLMVTVDPVVNGKGNLVGAVHITRDITQRKKDEKALRESEERYKYLFEQSPLGIGLSTPDGRVVCGNKAMEVITGYFEEELKKINLADTYENPQDRKKVLETIERYGCAVDFPTRLKRKDGTLFDALLNVSRFNLGGQDLFQTICMDITERKRAEEALLSERNKLVSVFEAMADGVYIVNQQHDIQYVNPVLEKDFGAWQGCKCYQYFHDRKEVCPWCKNEQVFAGRTVRWEWYSFKNQRTYDLIDTPLMNTDGSISKLEIFRDITERKRAEEALRAEKDKVQKYFDVAGVMFVAIDVEGKVTLINKKGCEILGYGEKEIAGKNWFDNFLPERIRDEVRGVSEKVIKGELESVEYHENPVLTKKGDERLIAWHNKILRDGKGEAIGSLSSGEDITDRKKAEEQIVKLAKFPAENSNPVLRISARGTVVYGNEASLPLLKVWRCRVGGSVSGRWYEFVLDALSSGQSQQTEVQCDGQTFSLVFVPVMDSNYVNVYGLDITERKQAEEVAREGRDYLEKLTNSMWDAVFSVKMPERVIEWANDSFRLTGYEPEDYVGSTTEFLYPDRKEYIDFGNKLKKAIEAGEDVLYAEQILRRKNGETFPAEITTTFFRAKGKIVRVTSIVSDITERKKAEKKLLEYQKQLKSLASQLTLTEEQERRRIATELHDNITQSLAMSKLKLDLVRDSKSSSSADLVEVLNETSKNIEHIIQEVRTLTFDLSSPILYELGFEAAVAEWLTERIEKEHYIATEFEDDGQPKPLDDDTRTVLFRDVRELLTNVVKHAQAKKVKVSVRKVGSRIHVSVEDDGRGFDPKEAAATAAKAGEFGLFSIRERLKQLGGNIEIESAAGHGTRVTLAAPLNMKVKIERGQQ